MTRICTSIALILMLAITGCASVSETIPTVKIVRKKPQTVATVMSQYQKATPTVQRAEAPMVCDNANMRARAADNNDSNDTARVLILEDSASSSTVLADVTVNCQDYFNARGQWANTQTASAPTLYSRTAAPAPVIMSTPNDQNLPAPAQMIQARSVTNIATNQPLYRIRRGDNLYRIARSHCTDYETLAGLNGIDDPSRISPGQVIKLPYGGC